MLSIPSNPSDKQVRPVPTGKVKWYDAEKGFGFLSQEEGEDVYVRSSALPEGVEGLKAGQRVEFVPIRVIYESERSHICPFLDTWRWLRWWAAQPAAPQ